MPAPDPMPKRAAKRIIGTWPVAGNHRPKMTIDVNALITTMMLKRPSLSERAFGTALPIILLIVSFTVPYREGKAE